MRGKISTFDFFEILTVIITFIVIIFTTALILAIVFDERIIIVDHIKDSIETIEGKVFKIIT